MENPIRAAILLFLLPSSLFAQAKPVPGAPDLLVFINGEQLSGRFEGATGDGITFNSPMAGEIKVGWSNIREVRSDRNFALLSKDARLTRRNALAAVPQGPIHVENNNIIVATSSGLRTVPVANADRLLNAAAFDRALNHPPGLLAGWSGAASGGVSLVRSTQNSTTFTGAINLSRSSPEVDWLPKRNRSLLAYAQSYGSTSQVGAPTVLTNIFHASLEQDRYFSPRLFSFGSATFDHNFAQSLNLQQAFGAGAGLTVVQNAAHQLDFKADIHYENQRFIDPTQDLNIAGSTFSETYVRRLHRGFVLNEFGSISPSWNDLYAYSAHSNANLVFPVYKGLGFNIGGVDDYLNNAPPGSKRNSTQFTTGISYAIKAR